MLAVNLFLREVFTVESLSLKFRDEREYILQVLSIVYKYTSDVTTCSNATPKTPNETQMKQLLLLKQQWIPFKHN